MTAAFLSAFESLLILWSENPGIAVAFCAVCLIVAWRFIFLSRVRIVQKLDAPEPEPLRRVVLDATARFPPKAQDRRRAS